MLSVNGPRLLARLDSFAAIGASGGGGVNRQALSAPDRQARNAVADIALDRGFEVFQDDIANLFVRRNGRDPCAPPFLIGSHLDTQPTGGRFDGALGTLAALEVLETLEDADLETERAVEMVAWTNEEGSRFAPGSMGSQAFVQGVLPAPTLAAKATDGATLAAELSATLAALPQARIRRLGGPVSGYLELHIEQGPVLEREGLSLGVVDTVQGTRWLGVRVLGEAAHAGTTPLSARRDPMMAATAGITQLYETIMPGDGSARMTIGRIACEPGSVNAIPNEVTFTLDLRHPNLNRLDAMEATVSAVISRAALARGCQVTIERMFDMPPAKFSPMLIDVIELVARERGISHRRMVSGAFHDALFVGRVAPAAMLFVPCRNGISHNENEFVEPEHSVLGADMLLHATLRSIAMLKTATMVPGK
jgi:N-carbamoyl-L-amino-acid hydrolase